MVEDEVGAFAGAPAVLGVPDVPLDDLAVLGDGAQVAPFPGREVVEDADALVGDSESLHEVGAYEARATRDEVER